MAKKPTKGEPLGDGPAGELLRWLGARVVLLVMFTAAGWCATAALGPLVNDVYGWMMGYHWAG
jgi:hypothetical protein